METGNVTVYVLVEGYDYETNWPTGVANHIQVAKNIAEMRPGDWHPWGQDRGGNWSRQGKSNHDDPDITPPEHPYQQIVAVPLLTLAAMPGMPATTIEEIGRYYSGLR